MEKQQFFHLFKNIGMKLFSLIIFMLSALNCAGQKNSYAFKPKHSVVLDSAQGKKLLDQCSRATPKEVSHFWNLPVEDIQNLEDNFFKVKKLEAKLCCRTGERVTSLESFAFQYIGIIINNRKYIYINAFAWYESKEDETMHKSWQVEPIIICDGGSDYWGVLFDLKNQKFYDLAFNGI